MRISIPAIINRSTCYRVGQISFMALLLTALTTLVHAATDIPSKGMTQDQVRNNFGEPSKTKAAVGQPPISRWDYENYSVYFEDKYVIHSFLHGQTLKPRLKPEPSAATSQRTKQQKEPGQDAQAMPDMQNSEPQVTEELEQTQEEIEKEIEEQVQASKSEAKDLNFEESPESANYSKWDY